VETFAKIYKRAAARKGGENAVELMLQPVKKRIQITKVSDADALEEMTKCVFRSGFVWKIIEAKWPGFQTAFSDFDVMHCAMLQTKIWKYCRVMRKSFVMAKKSPASAPMRSTFSTSAQITATLISSCSNGRTRTLLACGST